VLFLFCFGWYPTHSQCVRYLGGAAGDPAQNLSYLGQIFLGYFELISAWRITSSMPEELALDYPIADLFCPSGSWILFDVKSDEIPPPAPDSSDSVVSFLSDVGRELRCDQYLCYCVGEIETDVFFEDTCRRIRIPRGLPAKELIAWLLSRVFDITAPCEFFALFPGTELRCAPLDAPVCASSLDLFCVHPASLSLSRKSLRILYFVSPDGFHVGPRQMALFPESATVGDLLVVAYQHFEGGLLRAFRCTGSGKIRNLLLQTELLMTGNCFRIEAVPEDQDNASPLELMPVTYDDGWISISFVLLLGVDEPFEVTRTRINESLSRTLSGANAGKWHYCYKTKTAPPYLALSSNSCLYTLFTDNNGQGCLIVRAMEAPDIDLGAGGRSGASVVISN
jgi:hypothetical protein